MDNFQSVDDVLDFAIQGEEDAQAYYNTLADRVEKPWMKDLFKGFAREELGHKAKLIAVKKGRTLMPAEEKVMDLRISDFVEDVADGPDLSFQDALILAMKREKKSFRLYTDLAEASDNEELSQTFLTLAQEEAKHKLRIELIYDEQVLSDN